MTFLKFNFMDPKFLKLVQHALLLVFLTGLSAAIGPVYQLIVGALTASTPTLPLWVQQFLPLVLPIIGALVTKFQDEIAKELQDQKNDELAAKNMQLVHENTVMSKSLAAVGPEVTGNTDTVVTAKVVPPKK